MGSNRRVAQGSFEVSADRVGVGGHERLQERLARSAYGEGASAVNSRSQRRKRKRVRNGRPHEWRADAGANVPRGEEKARERIFQDVEGLLRRIREHAEETGLWSEARLSEITHTVTAFTRALEDEGDPISDRARNEYQRVREKLSQALKGMEQEATP